VHAADVDDVSRGAVRGAVRDALQIAFATSHVSAAICEAIVRARPPDLAAAVDVLGGLAREGALVGTSGHVEVRAESAESQRRWLDELDRRLTAIGGVRRESEEAALGSDVVARAERLLLRGDVLGAYPLLVRVTTEILAGDVTAVPSGRLVRVVDLWLEYGSVDAAGALLEVYPFGEGDLAILRRHGRVAALRDDAAELNEVVSRLTATGCAEDDIELATFRARVLQAKGKFDDAHAVLRDACSARRDRAESVAFAEALCLWGLVARNRRRYCSGSRLLGLARRAADELGATRLALRIDANILVMRSSADDGAATARAWSDLGDACRRWGLWSAGRRHFVRAAVLYMQSEDVERVERALADAESARALGGRASAIWRVMERYLDVQVRARRDLPLPQCVRPDLGSRLRQEWSAWLATHVAGVSLARVPDLTEHGLPRGERDAAVRLMRLVIRWVSRGGDASARLARVMRAADHAVNAHAPSVGALARFTSRGAEDDWPLVGLLAVLRDALDEDESVRQWALAFHASAFVWSGLSDSTAAAWLRSHAPEIDEARPFGTFAWEWRLAMLRADTILGHEPDVDARLEGVLEALESWSAAMSPELRAERMAVVPFDTIAATVGLAGPETLRIPDGGESLVAFVCRAERAVVVFEGEDGERRAKLATLERLEDVGADDAEVSESAIEHARRQGCACIFDDACGSAEFGDSPSVRMYRPRSLMIAPLQAHGVTLGHLYVENRSLPKSFSPSDLQLLEGFAAQAGLALDNARLVDELRSSLDELKRVRTEAVRAESLRVLGQMAGEVAHDFNNLLAVILGETQLLLQDRPDAGVERSLEVIERAAMDGAAAIRRIQSSTRARPREEFTVLDVGELVREVLDFTRVRWASGGTDPARAIRTRCRSARGVFVSGLAPELREVFTNLIINAVDAMPDGGDLLVSVRSVREVVEIEVRDTGSGIPDEIVERVFDPFFSTKGEGGNGLGLAIAKEIVERHGGALAVHSVAEQGTTFSVTLPAVDRPAGGGDVEAVPHRRAASRQPVPSRSVLVVDDEEGVLRVLAAMLRAEGFDVTAAASGEEATRRLEGGERFDVVITDLYMPGTSGVEVIETTRRTQGARRVVVMSGYGDVVGEGRISRQSVDGVLAKPFTLSDVREAVG
jgi:signal transduction histidine kinase/CheY-like chemotaxis protein